jgi:hypothetical protein
VLVPLIPPPQDPGNSRIAELLCHPKTPCAWIRSFQARAQFLDREVLSLGFTLKGDLDHLKLPIPSAPARTDRLWEHTCFEAFLAAPESEGYCELNVSPSSAWAAYRFLRYREGGEPAMEFEPRVVVHRLQDRLELHALLRLDPLPAGEVLRLGLSAVIEQTDGALSYWALKHPGPRPDFHHPEAFALALAPPPEED